MEHVYHYCVDAARFLLNARTRQVCNKFVMHIYSYINDLVVHQMMKIYLVSVSLDPGITLILLYCNYILQSCCRIKTMQHLYYYVWPGLWKQGMLPQTTNYHITGHILVVEYETN